MTGTRLDKEWQDVVREVMQDLPRQVVPGVGVGWNALPSWAQVDGAEVAMSNQGETEMGRLQLETLEQIFHEPCDQGRAQGGLGPWRGQWTAEALDRVMARAELARAVATMHDWLRAVATAKDYGQVQEATERALRELERHGESLNGPSWPDLGVGTVQVPEDYQRPVVPFPQFGPSTPPGPPPPSATEYLGDVAQGTGRAAQTVPPWPHTHITTEVMEQAVQTAKGGAPPWVEPAPPLVPVPAGQTAKAVMAASIAEALGGARGTYQARQRQAVTTAQLLKMTPDEAEAWAKDQVACDVRDALEQGDG